MKKKFSILFVIVTLIITISCQRSLISKDKFEVFDTLAISGYLGRYDVIIKTDGDYYFGRIDMKGNLTGIVLVKKRYIKPYQEDTIVK